MEAVLSRVRGNAVAWVALFVSLSGVAYATATIGAGDIKRDAIRSKHIKSGEVGPSDLAHPVQRLDLDLSQDTYNTTIGNFVLGFWCHSDAASAATMFGSATEGTGTAEYSWVEGDLNGANSSAHQEQDNIPTFSSNANLIEIQNKRAVGQLIYRDGTEVVTVIFSMTSNQSSASCQLKGTAYEGV